MGEPARDEHTVGIRDLSHRTSQILGRVRSGERLTITDRGEPIAAVVPLRRPGWRLPSFGYAASGDPTWAARATEELAGFGE
jgi:prevent-host-death family protein